MSAATCWMIVLTLGLSLLLVLLGWVGYVLFVKHEPTPAGLTCGWAGCPFCNTNILTTERRRAR